MGLIRYGTSPARNTGRISIDCMTKSGDHGDSAMGGPSWTTERTGVSSAGDPSLVSNMRAVLGGGFGHVVPHRPDVIGRQFLSVGGATVFHHPGDDLILGPPDPPSTLACDLFQHRTLPAVASGAWLQGRYHSDQREPREAMSSRGRRTVSPRWRSVTV